MCTRLPIPVTKDGGILKWKIEDGDPCKSFPQWSQDSKALFHYKAYTIPFKEKVDANDWFKSGLALVKLERDCDSDDTSVNDHCCAGSSKPAPIDPNRRNKVGDSRHWDGLPFELRIGRGFSVELMELAVKTMRIGEKARFFCQPQYAETYIQLEATLRQHRINGGQKRSNNHSRCAGHCSEELEACRDLDVLFGCPLEFEIHLLNVLQPGDYEKEIWEMTMDEKWQACWRLKESGNSQYRSKKHRKSANDYSKAIEILDSIATALAAPGAVATLTRDQVIDLRSTCRLNLAACALQLKEYAVTVQLCSAVLESDKSNPKALFRRAQARIRLGRDLDEAAQDLDTVCTIAAFTGVPSTAELQVESKLLQQKENQVSDKEKAMFGNIFWKNHSVAPVDE